MKHTSWRLLLSLFAIAGVMLVAVACGDDDDDSNGGTGTGTQTGGSGEPQQGGSLRVQYVDVQSWDPHFSSFAQDIGHHGFVWRGLYKLNLENEPVPEMAAGEPEVSDDGLTYTVTLKDGLKWSDGQPLTAEDFVAGIQRTCDPDIAGQYQYLLSNIVGCDEYYESNGDPDSGVPAKSAEEKAQLRDAIGVRAIDDKTIEFQLEQPQPTWPIILTMWMTYPVPRHIVPQSNSEWPTDPTKLAFNGPFVLQSYTPKSGAVFVRNENYAGEHQAYLDRVEFVYIEDNAQANNAFRSGEIQAALADQANLTVLRNEMGDQLLSYPQPRTLGLQMQMARPPLDNEKVRLALSRAIDRETLANVVLQGAGIPSTSWIPPDVAQIAEDEFDDEVGFDPEAARQLLEEAGFPNGQGFPRLTILIRDTPQNTALAAFLQSEFKEHLNIDVDIETVDSPTRSRRFTSGDFELFPGGWQQDYPDPENWILGQFETGGTLNHYNCSDPDIDRLIEQARFNTNNEERIDQYRQVNELIVTRACGVAPMYHQANHVLIKPNVGGMHEFHSSQDRVLAADWAPEEWYLKN